MNFPEIDNATPFAFAPLFLADEEGRPLSVLVTRATFAIDGDGRLRTADEQLPVNPAGEFWESDDQGSYRHEPDAAFVKVATDVVLVGSAYAPRPGATVVDVGIRVGPVHKVARVFGDRYWTTGLTGVQMSDPQPFESIPLRYERAFGGWDRSSPDASKHGFDPRNPLGTGFRAKGSESVAGVALPNIEDPQSLIAHWRDRPAPMGFGFTSPDWHPRARLAGTYDEAWARQRLPLLPLDFDRRFFNSASTGLVASGYLRGDEPVLVLGARPAGRIAFALPGIESIQYSVRLKNRPPVSVPGNLDTVVVDADRLLLHLTWRAFVPLRQGAHDLQEVVISMSGQS